MRLPSIVLAVICSFSRVSLCTDPVDESDEVSNPSPFKRLRHMGGHGEHGHSIGQAADRYSSDESEDGEDDDSEESLSGGYVETDDLSAPDRIRAGDVSNGVPLTVLAPRMLAHAQLQEIADEVNDIYTPDMTSDYETVPGSGRLTLGELLAKGSLSLVFTVKERPDLVIKYQCHCSAHPIHGLLIDYWLGVDASRLNLSAKPLFISPAAELWSGFGPKTHFAFTHEEMLECGTRMSLVRFMVMERVGQCLHEVSVPPPSSNGSSLSTHRAVIIGVEMVELLEKLHGAGIVHGDIHGGNVCYSRAAVPRLVLIDFGLGKFTESETNAVRIPRLSYLHPALTPWQLEGSSRARRDDVYKALHLVAELIVGPSLENTAERLAKRDPKGYLAWKRDAGSMLNGTDPDRVDALAHLPLQQRAQVRAEFAAALEDVLQLESVETPIDYTKIISHFRTIVALTADTPAPI